MNSVNGRGSNTSDTYLFIKFLSVKILSVIFKHSIFLFICVSISVSQLVARAEEAEDEVRKLKREVRGTRVTSFPNTSISLL